MWGIFGNNNRIPMMKTYKILLTSLLVLVSSLGFSQSVPSYVPTSGLVGWWGFNGNAQDGSGNGNHGTVNGATLTTDRFGNQNGAYDFDGQNDNVLCSQINLTNLTLSIWFKTQTGIQTNLNYGHPPIGAQLIGQGTQHGSNVTYSDFAFGISSFNSPNMYFSFEKSNVPAVQHSDYNLGDATNFLNIWNHGVITINGTTLRFYINEILYSIDTLTFPVLFSNAPLSIGSRFVYQAFSGDGNCNFFKGKLDDIGIWNRALSQQEITNLYNSQLPTQSSLCLPTITTTSPSSVGVDSVVIGGNITNDGGSSIVLRGVCYSTSPNPNMGNSRTEDGSGIGSFNTVLRGLTSSTTYYARSYAKNSNGVVVYGNEVSFTTSSSLPGLRCPGTPSVTDIDGNIYNTVQIGNQCWTQSNLKVSKYRNGDSIPTGLSNSDWGNTTSGAYAIYNNDPVNDGLYGKLYNHYAVTDNRGLCPTGWHVPSDAEWTTLANQLGGQSVAGVALKSTAIQPTPGGWPLPNSSASNSSGFTAIPGGLIGNNGLYYLGNSNGYWWTTTFGYLWGGLSRVIIENGTGLLPNHTYLSFGMSVRCLKNTLPQVNTTSVTNVTPSTALVTGEVISEGDQNTTRGFCYSTTSNPTVSNDTTMNGTGLGVYSDTLLNLAPSTTYYARAYATNSLGTSYANELNFSTTAAPSFTCGTSTVTDVDNNIYNTVQIGTQCWTQSNLKTSRYRNGDSIPTGLSNSAWQNTTSGAYAIFDNNPVNDGLYGKLYNHYTVTDSRGLCPTGWHVPSNAEWNILVKYLDPNADTVCVFCWQSNIAGGALYSTAGWNSTNTGATNSSGFTALPGGARDYVGAFSSIIACGYWWSSSFWADGAWYRSLQNNNSIYRHSTFYTYGLSVRCLKD